MTLQEAKLIISGLDAHSDYVILEMNGGTYSILPRRLAQEAVDKFLAKQVVTE